MNAIFKIVEYSKRNAYAWIAFGLIVAGASMGRDFYIVGFAMTSLPYFWRKVEPVINKYWPGPQ